MSLGLHQPESAPYPAYRQGKSYIDMARAKLILDRRIATRPRSGPSIQIARIAGRAEEVEAPLRADPHGNYLFWSSSGSYALN